MNNYRELVSDTKQYPVYFARWCDGSKDATGDKATPLEILVTGALRYLGRGWRFDDLFESTGVHAELHRQLNLV
jgi:ribosome-associated toxin RatA of RatAB toxin-antitoxin module